MIYWLHLAGRRVAAVLPLGVSYRVAEAGGWGVYWLWPAKRRNAVANLQRVLGADAHQAGRLARAAFRNYGKYLIDMMRLSGWQLRDIEQRLVVHGLEHVEAARAQGRGLIFVGGHIGNSDIGGAILAGRGYPAHVIAETLHPPRWNALVQETRRQTGMRVIAAEGGAREILRVLRRNEVLAFLVDRPTHREGSGVPVRFFGAWTRVPSGAATLALRTGASLIAACVVRAGQGYEVHISPPLQVARSGNAQADIQALTQEVMTALEGFIRQYPAQWFMFRPMWPAAAGPAAHSDAPRPDVGKPAPLLARWFGS
jgi:KDO2-lipid IV(A) lauroyltransferase